MIGKVMKWWVLVILVALVFLASVPVGAQRQEISLSAQRSDAVQTQLRAIDQDRARFVDQLLHEWAQHLDMYTYDIEAELRPIAMKAPAWQLYGASLVGDFPTMLRVLTGVEGAGPYINSIAAPQPKSAFSSAVSALEVVPASLGSSSDSLVFTPIAPCRVVDTRLSGAKTGILAVGVSRTFDFTTSGLAEGQGGAVSCTGLPSYSYKAWAVNITVTGYSGSGWLVAWPYSGTEPTSSVANYGTGVYALASGQTLTGCLGCGEDITVKAYNAATHVIIDVVGYYQDAGVVSSTVTRMHGTQVSIPAGGQSYVYGGACPAGTVMVGGELTTNGYDMAAADDAQSSSTTWYYWVVNHDGTARYADAYSRCMDTPIHIS